MSESKPFPFLTSRPWSGPALLVAATLLAYANSLRAPFVYDDILAIPQNPTIRELWPLTQVLAPQADGGLTVSGRPVLNLSFALNYAISGEAVWSYHVFNLLIHAGAGLLLFGIVRRTLKARPGPPAPRHRNNGSEDPCHLAFIIAALWLLHPLQTQAITYTVQRAESLMGFFYLLTLYAFVRGVADGGLARDGALSGREQARSPSPDWRWRALSVLACACGMATKEVMATAPLIVLLFDRTFVAGSFGVALRQRWKLHLALASTWLLLAALIASTGLNRGGTVGVGVGVPLWAYPLTQFKALATYLGLSLWPHPLVFEYGTWWVEHAGDIAPFALIVLPLLVATVMGLIWRPVLGFLGAWFFGILAPTSLAPGTIQMIVEHRMYLPLAAVVTLLVLLARRCLGEARGGLPWLGIAAALGLMAAQRNWDYRSHLALWADTVAKRPLNPRAHEGLAEAYAELGHLDAALQHRREAVRLLPDESTYHYNLGMTLVDAGRLDEAIRHYELSLRLKPDEPRTHNNLAIALGRAGRTPEALRHYDEAIRLRPGDPQLHYNFGVALVRAGETAQAIARFQETLRLDPRHADAHFNLASALLRAARVDEALQHYQAAIRLRPADDDYQMSYAGALLRAQRPNDAITALETILRRRPAASTHFKLASVLLDVERLPDAVKHYREGLQLQPDDAEAHQNLGVAYARLEEWENARRHFEAALQLKPDYPEAQRNLERLRALLRR